MPRRFDLVVFDWDGTLFDSTAAISGAIQAAAVELGLPEPSDEQARHVIGLGLADALAHTMPTLPAADRPRLLEIYRKQWALRANQLTLFRGARELIESLHADGITLAIATGKSDAGLQRSLEEADLKRFFAATRCADQTSPKPHPAMLLELTSELAIARDRTVMIGDTTHDLKMAQSAGVPSIGVTYGAHPREELATYPVLTLANSMHELAAWMRVHG
jgi:phosphoglycolate phosphatase